MVRRLFGHISIIAMAGAIASCSATAPNTVTTPTTSVNTTVEVDVTDQLAVSDIVTRAYEPAGETDRVAVETTITDPRAREGSPEAQQAIEACDAALALGYAHVTVFEADGSTFVVAGHPAYGDDCTEV